ncbi:MAG TPA: MinD/ParA family protein [Symbiobacteriaceae bacterium]|nr:MinD/ParA family protein [Symbiobacteriaceae bacterium]
MLDQASRLREMAAAYRSQALAGHGRRTRVIAVTSGKGGVGKTNLSINLGHALISAGHEVILLDADLGLANADILLGTVPPYHLGHLLRGERDIQELIHRTPGKLKLISGGSGVSELANIPEDRLRFFVAALRKLDGQADYLILDTGAGLSHTVQEFVLAADQVVVVTTPEPTSLADGYATIKMLAARRPGIDIRLVVNQAERPEEATAAAERIISTARNFLGLQVEYLGTIPRDPIVWQSVRRQVPFIMLYPDAPASRAVQFVAERLMDARSAGAGAVPEPARNKSGFFDRIAGMFSRRGSNVG